MTHDEITTALAIIQSARGFGLSGGCRADVIGNVMSINVMSEGKVMRGVDCLLPMSDEFIPAIASSLARDWEPFDGN